MCNHKDEMLLDLFIEREHLNELVDQYRKEEVERHLRSDAEDYLNTFCMDMCADCAHRSACHIRRGSITAYNPCEAMTMASHIFYGEYYDKDNHIFMEEDMEMGYFVESEDRERHAFRNISFEYAISNLSHVPGSWDKVPEENHSKAAYPSGDSDDF